MKNYLSADFFFSFIMSISLPYQNEHVGPYIPEA